MGTDKEGRGSCESVRVGGDVGEEVGIEEKIREELEQGETSLPAGF